MAHFFLSSQERSCALSEYRGVTGVVGLATFAILAIGVYPELFAHYPPLSTLVGR